jgi:hypothetical protein
LPHLASSSGPYLDRSARTIACTPWTTMPNKASTPRKCQKLWNVNCKISSTIGSLYVHGYQGDPDSSADNGEYGAPSGPMGDHVSAP